MEERNFTRDRPDLGNQLQRVTAREKFGSSKRIQNSFLLIPSVDENGSVFSVTSVLLPFRLNRQTNSGGIERIFVQYMKCTPVIDEL